MMNKVKSVNSEIENSVFLNGTWLSDKIVKIQSYEESNITWYSATQSVDYKMYKFYVTDTNWARLREFQNFYFQDLGINIVSNELLNFFDDKFSVGQYYRTLDTIGGKYSRRVLVQLSTKEENRNSPGVISLGGTVSMQPNDNALPSIDIFIEGGDDFVYGASSSYPRPFIADTIDITKSYILDSDFVSGLFKDSKWISGNYFNYNADYSLVSYNGINDGYMSSYDSVNEELILKLYYQRYRKDILGTQSDVQNITWINGFYYDSTLNGGGNIVKLSDTYKIVNIATFSYVIPYSTYGKDFYLKSIFTQSSNYTLPTYTNQQYIRTINAQNRWNYLHPVKFENSVISSGIFRRAYFENCQFTNTDFDATDRELSDVSNKRKLLLSDILFTDNKNQINSGLVQYSHFIGGSDTWNGGIFHRGIWNTTPFTYSLSPTSSIFYTSGGNTFKNGIFRNSTWVNGVFDNGLFYKNNTNIGGSSSTFQDTLQVYYIDNVANYLNTRWSWQNGTFNNGDFEKSNFEKGTFVNGNFYDSNFLTGEAKGGNFGKDNINYSKSRVWTGTFSNVTVINAELRAEDPRGVYPSPASINWIDGIFNKGIFGVQMKDPSGNPRQYIPSYPYLAIWENGIFNNGEFADTAVWYDGIFNNGKFTSKYKLYDSFTLSRVELNTLTQSSFAWQGGKFNGGEFGTGQTGSDNSTWYAGEFNGGKFQGKYWKNGIFTRGQFLGSGTYSTDESNYIDFYKSFTKYFYGFWEDGFVTKNKDKFVKDEKIWTELERVSTFKKKNPDTIFRNMFWNAGTFSTFDGQMDNSMWIDGTFQDGNFNNSVFNPYLNLYKLPDVILDFYGVEIFTYSGSYVFYRDSTSQYNFEFYYNNSVTFTQNDILQIGETYSINFYVTSNTGVSITVNGSIVVTPSGLGSIGLISNTFIATSTNLSVQFSSTSFAIIKYSNLNIYPGTQSGFRLSDSCIWENGQAYSSDFYYSKWKQGVFDSYATSSQGNVWGLIWQDGIVKYMNANNVYWEKGTWKNGNWNGSPFKNLSRIAYNDVFAGIPMIQPGFTNDIISNVFLYGSQSFTSDPNSSISIHQGYELLHMNNVFTFSNGVYSYDSTYNNENLSIVANPFYFLNTFGAKLILLPSNVDYTYLTSAFKRINTRFGNGQFLSGVWENGVWNEGWRDDPNMVKASNLNVYSSGKNLSYQKDVWTWIFELEIIGDGISDGSYLQVGDKVSIGNIVTIDINGNRRLYRGFYEIISATSSLSLGTSIQVSLNVNFPIRGIEKDSDNHVIYITKKNWLNGIFLNGYFGNSVWNNGYFTGFPYITYMEDTHWIDGYFKGGRFRGLTNSSIDFNSNQTFDYDTAVIQKFVFSDENVSGQAGVFKYNSWIDVNYYKTEGVNINKINNVYKQTSLGFTYSFVENNFYGYPTKDVLESTSTLRNGYDLNSRTYRLGWKWKEYTNYLEDVGEFVDINQLTYNNFNTTSSGFGIDNFINDGWTFSYLTQQDGFASATNSIISNIGNYDSEWLYISGGRRGPQNYPLSDNSNFTVDIFDNTNVTIDKLRYSFVEIEAETLNFTQSVGGVVQPVVFYNNYPATYSIAAVNTLFNGSNITIPINQIATQSVVNQREYFFNKKKLEMVIFSGPTYSLRFKKFRFVETDMIPFTQIADDCILFKTNALWNTTPPVTYPTTNNPAPFTHPYPGQWELALSEGVLSNSGYTGNLQLIDGAGIPTWDNFYLVFGGAGCTSYINEDVQLPYVSKAPDISTNIDFTYLTSDNVLLLQNPITQV